MWEVGRMRRKLLPFDVWLCLLLAALIAWGTGAAAEKIAQIMYEKDVEAHAPVAGQIGGPAGESVFQAQNVTDLLTHETFTVPSHGIEYRNRGAGYYGGKYFQALTLPSGELVAAWINEESVQMVGGSDYYTSDKLLPLGRVVYEDLRQNETFLSQIQFREPLSRTDFYIDMVGDTAVLDEEQAIETPKLVVQLLTVVIFFPLFHAAGSKLGFFPAYFAKKKRSEWE